MLNLQGQGVLVISPTPAGLMSEMLGSTPAAPSSAGSADNVVRERIAVATEGQARVSPLSGSGMRFSQTALLTLHIRHTNNFSQKLDKFTSKIKETQRWHFERKLWIERGN